MGYLERSAGIANFYKAVMSIWFRIPQEVIDAVTAQEDPETYEIDGFHGFCFYPAMHKMIPIFTFGSLETTYADSNIGAELPLGPSFIGIDCSLDPPVLAVNLQMNNEAVFNKAPDGTLTRPSCFYMGGYGGSGNQLSITGDEWHHILICFDLSTACDVTYPESPPPSVVYSETAPTFQWALDGVSRNGGTAFKSGSPLGDEDSLLVFHIYPSSLAATPTSGPGDSTGAWSSVAIATNGNPIGIPASSDFVSNVYNIETAEIQVFTDVTTTLDDNITAFRREADGKPADPSLAATLLGKSPEIYFHTHTDYITGTNRGTAGNFDKTGTISAFSPPP